MLWSTWWRNLGKTVRRHGLPAGGMARLVCSDTSWPLCTTALAGATIARTSSRTTLSVPSRASTRITAGAPSTSIMSSHLLRVALRSLAPRTALWCCVLRTTRCFMRGVGVVSGNGSAARTSIVRLRPAVNVRSASIGRSQPKARYVMSCVFPWKREVLAAGRQRPSVRDSVRPQPPSAVSPPMDSPQLSAQRETRAQADGWVHVYSRPDAILW